MEIDQNISFLLSSFLPVTPTSPNEHADRYTHTLPKGVRSMSFKPLKRKCLTCPQKHTFLSFVFLLFFLKELLYNSANCLCCFAFHWNITGSIVNGLKIGGSVLRPPTFIENWLVNVSCSQNKNKSKNKTTQASSGLQQPWVVRMISALQA